MDAEQLHILKMSNLPDYFVRMIREQEQLKERIEKLEAYLSKLDKASVDAILLRLQSNAMRNYEGILSYRIIRAIDDIITEMNTVGWQPKAEEPKAKDANPDATPAPTKTAE